MKLVKEPAGLKLSRIWAHTLNRFKDQQNIFPEGQMGKKAVLLKHNTDLPLVCLNGFPVNHCIIHLDGSLLWKLDPCQLAQQG